MSQILPESEERNQVTIDLNGMSPNTFQTMIARMVELSGVGTTVRQTTSSHDHGRDIILRSSEPVVSLFGHKFAAIGGDETRILLECKSSRNPTAKIGLATVAGSLSRCAEQSANHFALVTNTSITPHDYYDLQSQAKHSGKTFTLIDANVLAPIIVESGLNRRVSLHGKGIRSPYIDYQVTGSPDLRNARVLYLLMRNPSESAVVFSYSISSDGAFTSDRPSRKWTLLPHESRCFRVTLQGSGMALAKPHVVLGIDGSLVSLDVDAFGWNELFRPEFFGQNHLKVRDGLRDFIRLGTGHTRVFCIWGEAGVGKTRVLEEAIAGYRMPDRIVMAKCNRSEKAMLKHLRRQMVSIGLLRDSPSIEHAESLRELLLRCESFEGDAVLVLDDLQDASNKTLLDLESLDDVLERKDARIVLIGRDDFTGGSSQYYKFLSSRLYDADQMRVETLQPFQQEEVNLFLNLILGDDASSLRTILEHHGPQSVPLFAVSLARSLVDLGYARIADTSSIEVMKVDGLMHDLAFVREIEDIYRARLDSIPGEYRESSLSALYAACAYGKVFPSSILRRAGADERTLDEIFARGFLREVRSESPLLEFFHESFFSFLRRRLGRRGERARRTRASLVVMGDANAYESLDDLERGRVAFWARRTTCARECFSSAIEELSSTANDSAIDLDASYAEYWDEIFGCLGEADMKGKVARSLVYASLHQHNPREAIAISSSLEARLQASVKTECQEDLAGLRALRAHAHVNIGQLYMAESLLFDLYLRCQENDRLLSRETMFDVTDRLAAIYVRKNMLGTALALNAKSCEYVDGDPGRRALALMMEAKCWTFEDRARARGLVAKAGEILSANGNGRLLLHNELTSVVLDILDSSPQDARRSDDLLERLTESVSTARKHAYVNSIIRGHLLLSALYTLRGEDARANEFADKTIGESVKYGTGTYLWQAYNQKLILSLRKGQEVLPGDADKYVGIVHGLLRKQGLVQFGADRVTYANVLALANIATFYVERGLVAEYYRSFSDEVFMRNGLDCTFACTFPPCGGKENDESTCLRARDSLEGDLEERTKRVRKVVTGGCAQSCPLFLNSSRMRLSAQDERTGYFVIVT